MLDIRSLSPELTAIAQNECNEVPERIEESVEAIRSWIEKSPHIKAPLTDQQIVSLLRSCKYRLERTKDKLESGLTIATSMPEMFNNLYPFSEDMIEILKLGLQLELPLAAADGPRTFLYRGGAYDPNKYTPIQLARVSFASQSLVYNNCDNFAITGYAQILDEKDVTLEHLMNISPGLLKNLADAFQKGAPYRIKGLHFINFNPWIAKLLNFFKAFLTKKIQSRIFVHETLDDLYKYIPKQILPKEYGGDAGSIQELSDKFTKYVIENEEFFKIQQSFSIDEDLRPEKQQTLECNLGIQGSFRQLELD